MIRGFCGEVGSGKTLSAIHELSPWLEKGYRIVSNIPFQSSFPVFSPRGTIQRKNPFKLITQSVTVISDLDAFLYEFTNATKTLFFIDEAGAWMDAYAWESINREVYHRFYQHRKYEIHLLYTAQDFMTVAKRLRVMTNDVVECECVLRTPRDKNIPYSKGTPILLRQITYSPRFFNFQTYSLELEKKYILRRSFLFPWHLKKIFSMYDTKQDVSKGL